MIKFIFVLVLVLLGLFLVWHSLSSGVAKRGPVSWEPFTKVRIGEKEVWVRLARTDKEKASGLSGVESLAEDEGMLFVFDRPSYYPFWMKDMKFPIDIIWIGSDFKVVDLTSDLSPSTYPQTFRPQSRSQFVLEVGRGFVSKNKINLGLSVSFPH